MQRALRLVALSVGLAMAAAACLTPTAAASRFHGGHAAGLDPAPGGPLARAPGLRSRPTVGAKPGGNPRDGAGLARLVAAARQRFRAGDFAAALTLRRRLLALAIRHFGSASRPAAAAMAGLAALYIDMQRYLDAEPLLIVARRDLLARGGPSDPALLPVLCGLARVARARGAARRAQEWGARAVALAASETPVRPLQDAAALRALAAALAAERHFAASRRALRRALALDEEANGAAANGADANGATGATARDRAALGMVLLRQRRYAAALPLIERAALIDQARLGPTHPLIADDFHELGLAYFGLERWADAAAALRFAIWILVRGAGNGTARLAYTELTLARVLRAEGRTAEAEILFNDARTILGKVAERERRREDRS
jgi:tetratricopeptide (TPR) repeat protein